MPEAIVVGSGPNGLAARDRAGARRASRCGCSRRADTVGGGTRSAELTLPGFVHDVCAAIHPLSLASPFLRSLPLDEHGVEWVEPPAPLAHPFDDGSAALLERSIDATAATLGDDAARYAALMRAARARRRGAARATCSARSALPRHPLALARFAPRAALPATLLARRRFGGERARGLFAGLAAHSILPLSRLPSGGLRARARRCSVTPSAGRSRAAARSRSPTALAALPPLARRRDRDGPAGALAGRARRRARRAPRRHAAPVRSRSPASACPPATGARSSATATARACSSSTGRSTAPIPWRAEECARAATVHLGGTLDGDRRLRAASLARADGRAAVRAARPAEPLRPVRARRPGSTPPGPTATFRTASRVDMTERIEAQVERFAPGFRDRILARSAMGPAEMEAHNANYVGGDINGGAADLRQLFARPVARARRTRRRCPASSSAPPRRRPAAACTACAVSTPPGRRCATCGATNR